MYSILLKLMTSLEKKTKKVKYVHQFGCLKNNVMNSQWSIVDYVFN